MFVVAYTATEGDPTLTYMRLMPAPTEVDYPDRRHFTHHVTQDGASVIHRPLRDDRVREWVWKNYRSHVPNYEAQWKILESLEVRSRLSAGLDPIVYIWEDTTDEGGFGLTNNGLPADEINFSNLVFTGVKILQARRVTRKGGGRVTYDDSLIEFIIADNDYTHF